jgi:hypothetical protein
MLASSTCHAVHFRNNYRQVPVAKPGRQADDGLSLQERIVMSSEGGNFERMAKARAAIMKAAGDRRSVRGTIECPACERGVLEWFVMPNHHVHAECSSPGCLNWVE